MKRIIKISLFAISAIVLITSIVLVNYVGGEEITEGVYKIKDFPDYPDSYIEVKGDTIQFHNIDLNAIYRDKQMEMHKKRVERDINNAVPESKLEEISNLNEIFVSNAYKMPYDGDSKIGTFTYMHNCYDGSVFGLVIVYDSFNKTIKINNAIQRIVFEK